MSPAPDATGRLELPGIDVGLTMSALWLGPGDPHTRFEGGRILRAGRTTAGAATLRVTPDQTGAAFEAWGPGAHLAAANVRALVGLTDADAASVTAHHPLVAQLLHRFGGLRMTRTDAVWEALLPAIVGQKVSGAEARRSYFGLVDGYGQPAPGPFGLRLPPAPEKLARLPYHALHEFGIERRRAEALRGAAGVAGSLERLTALEPAEARRRLATLPGIGPWTAAETIRLALGDPDAVSLGDYNLPSLVAWLLAGEPRADDARMLELLAPYAGQRARVIRLLELDGRWPPRFGPRMRLREIASI
jgi:3-methyladenine DNA glycosylase/8-oxoguanine DNA glycosylase